MVDIGRLVLAAALPVVEVVLVCSSGAFARWKGILTADGSKSIAKLIYNILMPSLIIVSLGTSVTGPKLLSWWPLPVNVAVNVALGMGLGAVTFPFVRLPKHLWPHYITMAGVGNLGNLLIVLVPSIAEQSKDFTDDDADTGLAYVFTNLFAICIAAFCIAGPLLELPKSEHAAIAAGDEDASAPSGDEATDDQDSALSGVGVWRTPCHQSAQDSRPAHGSPQPVAEGHSPSTDLLAKGPHACERIRACTRPIDPATPGQARPPSRSCIECSGRDAHHTQQRHAAQHSTAGRYAACSTSCSTEQSWQAGGGIEIATACAQHAHSTESRGTRPGFPNQDGRPVCEGAEGAAADDGSKDAGGGVGPGAVSAFGTTGTPAAGVERVAHAEEGQRQGQGFLQTVRKFSKLLLQSLVNPPTIAIVIGVFIAVITPLRNVLFTEEDDGTSGVVPCTAVANGTAGMIESGEVAGNGGGNGDAPLEVVTTALARMGAAMVPSLLINLGAALYQGPGGTDVSWPAICALMVIRLVLLPVLGTLCVLGAKAAGIWSNDDPMFELVMLLQHAMPSALNLYTLAAMHCNHDKVVAAMLFWQYMACVVTIPVCVTGFLALVQ